MKRLTAISESGKAYYPYCFREDTCDGCGSSEKCDQCELSLKVCETLAAYENTGLTPSEIIELSESVKKVQEHFDGAITVSRIVDFFLDFYIAQGDDSRVEDAILLTNEEASRYRELKKRDTAKAPVQYGEMMMDKKYCGNCFYFNGEKGDGMQFCDEREEYVHESSWCCHHVTDPEKED